MTFQPPEFTPVVRWILLTTIGVFVFQLLFDRPTPLGGGYRVGWFTQLFGLSMNGLRGLRVWQLVSYAFLHETANFLHIAMNMLMFHFFGREMERLMGARRFAVFYFGCAMIAGAGWLLLSRHPSAYCIGASGAVFGVAGAFAAVYPRRELVFLFFFIIPMRMTARRLALLMAGVTVVLLFVDSGSIAHAAHLAGGLAGYGYGLLLARRLVGGDPEDLPLGRRRSGVVRGPAAWFERDGVVQDIDVEVVEPVDKREVDRILDKIHAEGVQSLTHRERQVLEEASRRG